MIAIPLEITKRSAETRYVGTACKNSELSRDLDLIVKSLA